jgi:hypothetical protein
MNLTVLNFNLSVMCPDRKLKWFKDHGHTPTQIKDIKKLVINRFNESYVPDIPDETQEEVSQVKISSYDNTHVNSCVY